MRFRMVFVHSGEAGCFLIEQLRALSREARCIHLVVGDDVKARLALQRAPEYLSVLCLDHVVPLPPAVENRSLRFCRDAAAHRPRRQVRIGGSAIADQDHRLVAIDVTA